jgi:hypothetical protein
MTRETVLTETPANDATSLIVMVLMALLRMSGWFDKSIPVTISYHDLILFHFGAYVNNSWKICYKIP